MKRALACLAASMVIAGVAPALADHNADEHSDNIAKVGNFDDGGEYRQGTDLAFWGDTAILGNYDNPGGFYVVDISNPESPRKVGQLQCPGAQNDVSIWDDLVFLSVDSPRADEKCGSQGASQAQLTAGTHWEGIRIVSIDDPSNPTPVAMVKTDCGSHTHTLVPDSDNGRVFIYVSSYPLGAQYSHCSVASHRKISVIEVPLDEPEKARVVSTPDVSPAIGCHDITVLMSERLAAAACISESQIWDIEDPANPQVVAHIVNPAINIHHSAAWSYDGKTIVIGDELGGAAATPGCFTEGHLPLGALWFYDVSDRDSPQHKGTFVIPNQEVSLFCTAHNFNTIPLAGDRDLLVSGWYNGGTTVIDFTDPSNPEQLGFYIPKEDARAASWSSYWYDGLIYSNNFDEDVNSTTRNSRGFDVFRFDDPATRGALRLGFMNAQTQMALPVARASGRGEGNARGGGGNTKVLGETLERTLPATGAGSFQALGVVLLAMASALGARLRR